MRIKQFCCLLVFLLCICSYSQTKLPDKVSLNNISPKGKEIYEKEKDNFPKFDRQKYEKEAEEKFPLVKIGETITITTKRNVYTGKFGGMKGRSTIIVDDKPLPVIDIPHEELIKYSPEENAKKRDDYVNEKKNEYSEEYTIYIEELKKKIFLQYPKIDESQVLSLFSNIKEDEKRSQLMQRYIEIYYDSQPIEGDFEEFSKVVLSKILNEFQDLCIIDNKLWLKEEYDKKLRQIKKEQDIQNKTTEN